MFIIHGIVVPSGLFTQTMSMGCGVWRSGIASCLSLHPSSNAIRVQFSSGQFGRSVMSDSLRPHGLQHNRFPCPSPTLGACSNSHPLSQWRHSTISSSVTRFTSCLQSSPASGSFPMSQFFASGGQSVGSSASVLPMNSQGWFPLGWTGLISLQSKGLSRVFSKFKSLSSSTLSFLTLCDPMDYTRNSPGQNTGVGSLSLLQGIFPTQGLNLGLPHGRQILYQLSHQRNPGILKWVAYPFPSRSSWPRNWTGVSCIVGRFFTNWAIRKPFFIIVS